MENIDTSLNKALDWVRTQNFKGFDPYDGTNSVLLDSLLPPYGRGKYYAQQIFKRLPINLRHFFQIYKTYNPKALGLLLSVYSKLYVIDPKEEYILFCEKIIKILINIRSSFQNLSWGYSFDWIGKDFYLKKYKPSIVVTSTVVRGLYDFFNVTNNQQIITMIESSTRFITEDLPRLEKDDEICFSYTPYFENRVHNANLLGAESLLRHYSITGSEKSKSLATKAFNYTIRRQQQDGSWKYSEDLGKKERIQTDWHQGFILDSIGEYLNLVEEREGYLTALHKGANFYYRVQFKSNGTGFWRYPQYWPIDIHNQSQGIITFAKVSVFDNKYLDFSKTIADWTSVNMQSQEGFFFHQKWPIVTNKIPYLRWSQAWMLYALVTLKEKQTNETIS